MMNYIDILERSDNEQTAKKNGHKQLSGKDIKKRITGKQFLGDYLHGFKFIIAINSDGSLEGKNNYQHYDIGRWSIDEKENTMSVKWQHGWDNTTTRLYEVDQEIRMYDIETGKWRTSLIEQLDDAQNIESYRF